jgi:alcohol dehydrogenase class IV
MDHFRIARDLLREFKGDAYRFGNHVLQDVGTIVSRASRPRVPRVSGVSRTSCPRVPRASGPRIEGGTPSTPRAGRPRHTPSTRAGKACPELAAGMPATQGTPSAPRAVLVHSGFPGIEGPLNIIRDSLAQAGVALVAQIRGAAPNTPREDLFRITNEIRQADPDVIVSFGGGSPIDATKAAEVLRTLGGEIDDYFGTGLVTKKLQATGRKLTPHIAIQTAAGSAAHLTKYSNITDLKTGQKKLIVDEAIVPPYSLFDHSVTHHAPPALTADGAMDGLAHILEVFYGAVGKPYYDKLSQIAETGIALIVNYLPRALPGAKKATKKVSSLQLAPSSSVSALHTSNFTLQTSQEAREALCLATDLGGYAIMVGGTNGGHLTSFSLVDILSHGRACALLNPYYTVFFAPAVEGPLRVVGGIFQEAGYISQDLTALHGRDLGVAVADGMFAFAKAIDFPTTLGEVKGFTRGHLDRALAAAKNPQLKMKLENMPVPLTAERIDDTMGPILEAAVTGDLSLIRTT